MFTIKNISRRIYFGLIILLALLSAVSVFFQGNIMPASQELPASKPVLALVNALIMLFIYGGLGYAGLRLSEKIGFTGIWEPEVDNRKRFIKPALIGAGLGVLLILIDLIFSNYNSFGRLPHPAFPTSLIASATAGIGEEVIFRLFFISFWVWLISFKILKGKHQNRVFWVILVFSGIVFTFSHFPSFMFLTGTKSIASMSGVLMLELFIMNGIVSLFAGYYFKQYGFLAAVGIHFWTDVIWHVLWGLAA